MEAAEQNEYAYKPDIITCEDEVQDCRENEICIKGLDNPRDGFCQCVRGYKRNVRGNMIESFE